MKTSEAVEKFLKHCEAKGLAELSVKWYTRLLTKFAVIYEDLPVDPSVLEGYIASYPSGDQRRHGLFRALRALYRFCYKRFDTSNTMGKVSAPKRAKKEKPTLTLDELNRVLEHPGQSKPVRALLYLLADTGCRISEARNIRKEDILDGCRLRIDGKTGERLVPLSENVREMLLQLKPEDFVIGRRRKIISDTSKVFRWTKDCTETVIAEAMARVGLKGRAHLLRHTFCSLYTGDLLSLQYCTGHANLEMLNTYRHQKFQHALEAHKTHSPLALLGKNGTKPENISQEIFSANAQNKEPVKNKKTDISELINGLDLPALKNKDMGIDQGVLQLLPSPGWRAVLADDPFLKDMDNDPYPNFKFLPLVAWAQVREYDAVTKEYISRLVGLVAMDYIKPAEDLPNFLEYLAPDENVKCVSEWRDWYEYRKTHP